MNQIDELIGPSHFSGVCNISSRLYIASPRPATPWASPGYANDPLWEKKIWNLPWNKSLILEKMLNDPLLPFRILATPLYVPPCIHTAIIWSTYFLWRLSGDVSYVKSTIFGHVLYFNKQEAYASTSAPRLSAFRATFFTATAFVRIRRKLQYAYGMVFTKFIFHHYVIMLHMNPWRAELQIAVSDRRQNNWMYCETKLSGIVRDRWMFLAATFNDSRRSGWYDVRIYINRVEAGGGRPQRRKGNRSRQKRDGIIVGWHYFIGDMSNVMFFCSPLSKFLIRSIYQTCKCSLLHNIHDQICLAGWHRIMLLETRFESWNALENLVPRSLTG
jgi:hypothetical protein